MASPGRKPPPPPGMLSLLPSLSRTPSDLLRDTCSIEDCPSWLKVVVTSYFLSRSVGLVGMVSCWMRALFSALSLGVEILNWARSEALWPEVWRGWRALKIGLRQDSFSLRSWAARIWSIARRAALWPEVWR